LSCFKARYFSIFVKFPFFEILKLTLTGLLPAALGIFYIVKMPESAHNKGIHKPGL